MFKNPSFITRVAVGKLVGFILGLSAFVFVPVFMPEAKQTLIWAFFLWYITFGAVIGAFGVMTRIPILNIAMPWWFRGPYIGGWLNFVIVLFSYDDLSAMMTSMFGENGVMSSSFWLVLEGCIVGFIVDFFATKYGGEGAATVQNVN